MKQTTQFHITEDHKLKFTAMTHQISPDFSFCKEIYIINRVIYILLQASCILHACLSLCKAILFPVTPLGRRGKLSANIWHDYSSKVKRPLKQVSGRIRGYFQSFFTFFHFPLNFSRILMLWLAFLRRTLEISS